jgi:Family of unknown function (DUF6412)
VGLLGSVIGVIGVIAAPVGLTSGTTATVILAAIAIAAAATVLLAIAAQAIRSPRLFWPALRATIRQQSEQTMYLRLRAPDAAGRPHPRAPSVQPTAG